MLLDGHFSRATLVIALFVALPLAGCATQQEAEPTVDDDGDVPLGDDGPADTGPPTMTSEEAAETFRNAMSGVSGGEAPVERISMHAEVESLDPEAPSTGEMEFLLDTAQQRALMSISGDVLTQDDEPGQINPFAGATSMVFAQYARTTMFGPTDSLFVIYNESADPVEGWGDFHQNDLFGPDEGTNASLSEPSSFMDLASELPPDAEITHTPIVHEGEPAVEIVVMYEDSERGTVDLRAIIWTEPELPALVEGTFSDPAAENAIDRHGQMTMTFSYGDDATHELEHDLARAETLALINAATVGAGLNPFGAGAEEQDPATHTVQNASSPGLVPLDEVEAWAMRSDASGNASSEDRVVTLPLEQGSATADGVTLTYNDVDSDGHVSPGDTIELTSDDGSHEELTVSLHDEVTGITVVPGPGVLALLVMTLAASMLRRRG